MNTLAANVIWALHMLFILWVVITPFSHNEPMLVMHLITMPFLWFHWILHEDTCSLTLMEMKLRGVSCNKSFFHNLVSPVYKIEDNEIRDVSWMMSILLWLITLTKVMKRPSMIKDVFLMRYDELSNQHEKNVVL